MKIRMSVARCCCDGVAPPVQEIQVTESNRWPTGDVTATPMGPVVAPFFGYDWQSANLVQTSGWAHYTNVPIPQGTVLNQVLYTLRPLGTQNDAATLTFPTTDRRVTPLPNWPSGGTYFARCQIHCEDTDNALTYPTNDVATNATRTTAFTDYSVSLTFAPGGTGAYTPTYPAGSEVTIDVTAPVQEVINRPGWASGNALMLIFDENNSDVDAGNGWSVIGVPSEFGNYAFASLAGKLEWS